MARLSTAELHNEQRHTDIAELMIINDETVRKMQRTRQNGKKVVFCKCGSNLPGLESEMMETLRETTKQATIYLSGLQWQMGRRRGLTRHLSQEGKEYQNVKCPSRKS